MRSIEWTEIVWATARQYLSERNKHNLRLQKLVGTRNRILERRDELNGLLQDAQELLDVITPLEVEGTVTHVVDNQFRLQPDGDPPPTTMDFMVVDPSIAVPSVDDYVLIKYDDADMEVLSLSISEVP